MQTRHSLGSLLPLFACACVLGLAAAAHAAALDPKPRTPPPYREPVNAPSPFREVLLACGAELSILCKAPPTTVAGAKACLEPRVQVVRKACRKVLGLKKS
ncbi:MAG: hypothetical protein HY925_05090 [Elusimicrobia bacterium]|nr:hypothetical protein [Elusimicrobiota bacterium]